MELHGTSPLANQAPHGHQIDCADEQEQEPVLSLVHRQCHDRVSRHPVVPAVSLQKVMVHRPPTVGMMPACSVTPAVWSIWGLGRQAASVG